MNAMKFSGALALTLALGACNQKSGASPRWRSRSTATNAMHSANPSKVFSGAGAVQSISGDEVTIAHGPIEGLGWPAMTMTFTSPPDLKSKVAAGDKVTFAFRQQGSAYVLTSLQKK